MLLSKATYIALNIYILSVHVFAENQTHDLDIALGMPGVSKPVPGGPLSYRV